MSRLVIAARAEDRLAAAAAWLAARRPGEEVIVVGASYEAASELIRRIAATRGTGFGWHRLTLGRLATELANRDLAARGLAPAGALAIEALCARVLQRLRAAGELGRLARVADRPGLPRALARTLSELRMAGATTAGDPPLDAALRALEAELAANGLADRAAVFELAAAAAAAGEAGPLVGLPLVLLDVPVRAAVERRLLEALLARAPEALATTPVGDDRSAAHLRALCATVDEPPLAATSSLGRVQRHLFTGERPDHAEPDKRSEASGGGDPAGLARGAGGLPRGSDERSEASGGGDPAGLARGAGGLPRGPDERSEASGGGDPAGLARGAGGLPRGIDATVDVLSAPGESRECVELARRVLREAERGVPFDCMAVLLRSPAQYRVHLEEALGRAGVPVHFEQGTVLPDPSGRAFLALLACAAEGLSARRFAEYASIGEVPASDEGAPPPPAPPAERWIPPDEELLPQRLLATDAAAPPDATAEPAATVPPWRWERLLVEAAVIGGRDRWERRLAGLEATLRLRDEAGADGAELRARMLEDLAQLRRFALPLLDELAALPALATWGVWLDRLGALATRALRHPERVLAVLAALAPMREVGPVALHEVRLVLQPRLAELIVPPTGRRHGKLLVAPIEAARGLAFDVVFVPGLAERMFPQKLAEDPLLLDARRDVLEGLRLVTRGDRLADERLQLRLAIGAARDRVVLSYPRIDLDQGRPRVPSFYGLEVLEAATGALPGFDELARSADVTGSARIGWPAPSDRLEAIDEAEHDLALLDGLLRPAGAPLPGTAAYLLAANPHLARSLRFRARRWTVRAWKPADGLIAATEPGRAALAAHAPAMRSFSPTALEQLAQCPYRFALRTILKLEPRVVPEAIETLGPLERGSLIHEVQFELLGELREAGLLPVRDPDAVLGRIEAVLHRVAARYRDALCPAIERVWDDGIAAIHADLREWIRQLSEDLGWVPYRFELAFGPVRGGERDPASVAEPVAIEGGLALRGSIDLVERDASGALRATDYKTGRSVVNPGAVIAGGRSLQPVMYALVLERMFPGAQVAGGRLSYCTTRGGFRDVVVPLDDRARAAARLVGATLGELFERGFFPAAPDDGACTYCAYRPVCGPYEEERIKRHKAPEPLVPLRRLREAP